MQLASHGARAVARNGSSLNMLSHPPGARNLHTVLQPRPSLLPQSAARRVLTEARTFLGRFFAELTAPGIGTTPSVARSFHGGSASRIPSIQSRLSLPARTMLAKSLEVRHFPRVPTAPRPCTVTNVGLGTARNFSTGRTVFQSFAENVPVALRAFNEVDLDIKASKENFKRSMKTGKQKQQHNNKNRLLPKDQKKKKVSQTVAEKASSEAEMEKYFTSSMSSNVTSHLLIPLAPTDYSSPPADPGGGHERLFPLSELASIHNSHELHSLRVSSLFARLDAANVWERGVLCSAYAQSTDLQGTCTILKIEFQGWTKDEVRSVIGESGSGWCVLEETRTAPSEENDMFSDTLSDISEDALSGSESCISDSATQSLILPTLDFSSSFLGSSTVELATPESDTESWVEDIDPMLGFSSDFISRGQQRI